MACATFYYSIDGASESERLSADALPELLAAGTIQPTTLIFSEEDGFTHDGWTAWSVCCAAFGFPAPPSAPGGSFLPCASLVYSTDGATQSPVVSAAEARALAGAGTIVGATLIFSEQPGFPFESWTPWADCHHCFAPAAPPSGGALGEAPLGAAGAAIAAPAAAACSSLFYAGDPERLLSVPEALALVDAGTIGPTTLIFSEQPAFEFDDWTPWAACSFCFGAGERESSLSSAAQQQQQQQAAVRSCSSLFYSSDGASASEAIDAATAHELAKVGYLPPSLSPSLSVSLSLSLSLSLCQPSPRGDAGP